MKVAVVGTGISGMVAAHYLRREHDVTVYEADERVGGHTNTVEVDTPRGPLPVDTGFIVFNERTYPNFCALLGELGVAWQESDMSFSARNERSGREYNGTNLSGLFAQRTNLLRPSFVGMVRDILRFYREVVEVLDWPEDDATTLGEYLERGGYGEAFVEDHLIPMGAAIWSARPEGMRSFPLRFFVQFFHNHGFLLTKGRPQWLTIAGGSREYARRLTAPFLDRIRLSSPVTRVERAPHGVLVQAKGQAPEVFDRVVLGVHSDQALRMLVDADEREREILGAFGYQRNEAVLHTDTRLMPRKRRAWASWNYHVTAPPSDLPTVTYWMNNLQALDASDEYLLTLNRNDAIEPSKVLRSFVYHHPMYSTEAVRAQARHGEIDGVRGVHFCGAYWGYGFHEDGVKSALAVVRNLERVPVA